MAEMAADGDSGVVYGSSAAMKDTVAWDADVMQGCVCNSTWEVGFGAGQYQLGEYFNPDCSLHRCPSGDNPYTCHNEEDCYGLNQIGGIIKGDMGNKCHVECSNRGICDYATGTCLCFAGSTGMACEMIVVGHGIPDCLPTTYPSPTPTSSYNPTSQPTTIPSSQPSAMPSTILYLPSNITRCRYINNTISSNSLTVNCTTFVDTFDAEALIFCAAFPWSIGSGGVETASAPSHPDEIISFQHFGRSYKGVAIVTVTNLVPITKYDVYCTSLSTVGVKSPMVEIFNIENVVRNITTDCCKTLTVQLEQQSSRQNQFSRNAVKIIVSSPPGVSLNVSLSIENMQSPGVTNGVYFTPSSIVGVSDSSKDSISATKLEFGRDLVVESGATPSIYKVTAVLSGISAFEYTMEYSNSPRFVVLSATAVPDVPTMEYARFSNDGASVVLSFDSDTNMGNMSSISFDCVQLLVFSGASGSVCQWVDSRTLSVVPSPAVVPGHTTISPSLNNTIRAACIDTTAVPCQEWNNMNSSVAIVVEFPLDPVIPEVIVFGPKTIGSCSNLTIDISSSHGSAGRDWINRPVFSITGSSAANESNLLQFLNSEYEMYPPSVIPWNYFNVGDTYSLTVTLCNFFLMCGNGSYLFIVDDEELVPTVSIIGPMQQTIHRKDTLSLSTHAILQRCDGHVSYGSFEYTWLIYPNGYDESVPGGGALTSISTMSNNPSILRVASHTLLTNYFYSIEVSVMDVYTHQRVVSPSVLVFVEPGDVVSVVTGGTQLSIKYLSTLVIDGSESYDEDVAGGAKYSNLTYRWTCVQMEPSFSTTCPFSHTAGSESLESFVLNASSVTNLNIFNTLKALVSLLVVDAADETRFSKTSVMVVTVPTSAPHIEILTTYLQKNVLTTDSLFIAATVETSYDCVTAWTVNDTSLQLPSISSVNISRVIKPSSPQRVYLRLYPNTLIARYTYLFSLSCGATGDGVGITTVSSVIITTNGPPHLGTFQVSPQWGGRSLITSFAFLTSNWVDQDLPITYSFGYCPPAMDGDTVGCTYFMPIRGQSQVSYGYSMLPPGNPSKLHNLTCFANVYDSLGAYATKEVSVEVLPSSSSVNASYVYGLVSGENGVSRLLSASTSEVDAMKQVVSVFSSVLNAVNCSTSTLCSEYNRESCSEWAHTCGECLTGYIGVTGHHNSICTSAVDSIFDVGAQEYLATLPCLNATDCVYNGKISMWYACNNDTKKCEISNKHCQNNCTSSAHGTCTYFNTNTGEYVSNCALSDSSCSATCQCYTGFAGVDCSLTEAEFYHQTQIRNVLASKAYTLTLQEAVSEASVTGWISGISEVAKHASYLSSNSTVLISQAIANTMKAAASLDMSHSFLEAALGALSNAAYFSALQNAKPNNQVVSNSLAVSNRRQLSSTKEVNTEILMDSLSNSLELFCERVIAFMLPEDDPYVAIYDSFRIGIMSIAESDLESPYATDYVVVANSSSINIMTVDNFISVSVPSTQLEMLLDPAEIVDGTISTNSTVISGIPSVSNSTRALFPVSSFGTNSSSTLQNGAITSYGAIGVFEINRFSFGTKTSTGFHTNPVKFQASNIINASSTDMKVTLRNAQSVGYSPIYSSTKFTTVCVPLLERNYTYECPTGPDILHRCVNTSTTIDIIESHCAITLQEPQCSNVVGIVGDVEQAQCTLVSFGDWETVCECPFAATTSQLELTSSSSQARKLSSTIAESVVHNTTYSLVTLTKIAYEVSPISRYHPDNTAEPSLLVFGLLGILSLVVLFWFGITFLFFNDGDKPAENGDAKINPSGTDNEKIEEAVHNYLELMIPQVFIPARDVNAAMINTVHPTRLSRFSKIRSELWRYHKYLRIFHRATSRHERNRIFVSICYVFSVLIMIMFLVSTIYDISFPNEDDGSCEYHFTEEDCLMRTYDEIYPPRHYCTWRRRYVNVGYEPVYTCVRAPIMYPRINVRIF